MTFGRIILDGIEPVIYPAGLPITGATLQVNLAGLGLATIYADAAGTTPILNPQTSDSAGRFYKQSTTIWADSSQAYDLIVTYPAGGSTTYLNVYTAGPAPAVTGFAPINSPVFTGTPQAPTPASSDASGKLATTQFVATAIAGAVIIPPGQYGFFAMQTLPAGWLLCAGQAVSRTTYAALFGAIGTTYGVGDGTTTFNVPNFQGIFMRGLNPTGSGQDNSRTLGSLQADQVGPHGHYNGVGWVNSNLSSTPFVYGGVTNDMPGDTANGGGFGVHADTGSASLSQGRTSTTVSSETRPINYASVIAIHI